MVFLFYFLRVIHTNSVNGVIYKPNQTKPNPTNQIFKNQTQKFN